MRMLVLDIEIDSDYIKHPAIPDNRMDDVYFLKDNRIIGIGSVGSSYMGELVVYLKDQASKDYFAEDFVVKTLGKHAGFRFSRLTGEYVGTYDDEPSNRADGVTIVDKFYFDIGFSGDRYKHIDGYGNF
jgi:hypothetical protein